MAFPAVETTNESAVTTAGTSHAVSLPTGITAGDLILILADKGSTAATFNTHADYTEIVDENLANGITVWVRKATGGESNPTFTSSASTRSAHISYRISGAEDPATQLPELSTVATGSSTAPNATTCTPTGGAKDYLWITFFGRGGEEADDDTWVTSAPANYSSLHQKACGVAGTNLGGIIASAQRTNNAASEDAGAFTIATGAWRAYTIAVHPASITGTVAVTQDDQTSSASGTVTDPPFIVTARAGSNGTAGTSHTVTLPDGSNVSGRLVVIGFSCDGGTVSWPAGWSELTDQTSTGVTLSTAYRIIDGTEGFDGTDDSISVGTSVTTQSNFHPRLIQGAHASTAPEAASTAPGTPDPPNLDPTGWDVEESLWIAFSASRFSGSYTAAPANYTNLLSTDVGSDVAPLGSAFRILSAGSENPGTFTESGSNTSFITATVAIRPAGSGVTGTLSETQDDQTSSASGQLGYSGTTSVTQAAQTSTATGQLGYSGTVAVTQASQTSAASGQLGSTGTLAVAQADQTCSASGTVGGAGEVTGTLAETQDAQTSTATGQLGSSGVLAASQGNQTVVASGWIEITGTITETQDAQTVAAAGQLGSTGTLAATQANQAATAAGWITVTGLVARTQDPQTCAATGFVGVIPTPAGRPLSVPAGTHVVTAESLERAVTVPAGTHVVEAR